MQTHRDNYFMYVYIDKGVNSVCLFWCPIITQEPLDRLASNLVSVEPSWYLYKVVISVCLYMQSWLYCKLSELTFIAKVWFPGTAGCLSLCNLYSLYISLNKSLFFCLVLMSDHDPVTLNQIALKFWLGNSVEPWKFL